MMDSSWFTEVCKDAHIAFSLNTTKLCHEETTPYQTIHIYETKTFGHLMTIDGFIMLSQRDNFFYHEMMSHLPLLSHPNPQSIAIIGGGDCGTLKECLKHPISKVTQIEIDRRVTQLSEKYFPELCESNHDSRAELLFIDGIEWVKNAEDESLDIIIVDSTDPIGPAEGLFNLPFYKECFRALKKGGIFVQQSESPLIHQPLIRSIRQSLHEAGFSSRLTYTFPQPVYPSGFWSATMAVKDGLPQFRQDPTLTGTHYYCPQIHQAALHEIPMIKRLDEA